MKSDIILAGVGGQGILSIATALGEAALANNLLIKQAETHGMSQRGGGGVFAHAYFRSTYCLRFDTWRICRFDSFSRTLWNR